MPQSSENGPGAVTGEQENEIIKARRAKLETLLASGAEPYKSKFGAPGGLSPSKDLCARFKDLENGSSSGETASVAGRIMAIREHGKATFADLKDSTGKIQLLLRQNVIGDEAYSGFHEVDIGDIVGATGTVLRSKRGELSISIESYELLSKSIRPLPEKWHGFKDTEQRFRQRYLDLLMNEEARRVLDTRSRLISELRRFLDERGFVEVETPILQPLPGGAAAKPFKTFHNTLGMDLYMRIAPELYLKRLLVGGYDKVYELNRNFRNEGISTRHNPEFTMLEAYQAYVDYHFLMNFLEEMISTVVEASAGSLVVKFEGNEIDFSPPWKRLSMVEAINRFSEIELDYSTDEAALRRIAGRQELEIPPGAGRGWIIAGLFEKLVEGKLVQPAIIHSFPEEISPLARKDPDLPGFTERFEVFVGGQEIANAFSELTDPMDQRRRFEVQAGKKAAGDDEAHPLDEDFLTALEYGMPPAGGLGVGIDRLVMLATGKRNIKEVIIFPHMRPSSGRHGPTSVE
ncbi:MAG: lysine--tRNA ligase [Actinobacteria bacterium]|nr:lysine--tRNA ligase [Actinomycetota bacterium]